MRYASTAFVTIHIFINGNENGNKKETNEIEREWESEVGKLFPVIHRGLELHAKFMNSSHFLIPSMSEWKRENVWSWVYQCKREREREREVVCACVCVFCVCVCV